MYELPLWVNEIAEPTGCVYQAMESPSVVGVVKSSMYVIMSRYTKMLGYDSIRR